MKVIKTQLRQAVQLVQLRQSPLSRKKRTGSSVFVLCSLLMLGGTIVGGCGSGSGNGGADTGGTDTTRLIGFWSLVRTSGGISGSGYPVTSGMELLTFSGNGTYARTVSGQTTTGTYKVTERKTLLGAEKRPVITYSPSTLPDVVSQVDAEHLVVHEEAADGFQREYERSVQTN